MRNKRDRHSADSAWMWNEGATSARLARLGRERRDAALRGQEIGHWQLSPSRAVKRRPIFRVALPVDAARLRAAAQQEECQRDECRRRQEKADR
jgi:hypothetical protein